MTEADSSKGINVVVIGAGVIGSVLTYRLAQAGAKVTVVERGIVAGGATYGSFAWTNVIGKEPREYFDLNMSSVREHDVLVAELEGNWLHPDGGLVWVNRGDEGKAVTGGTAAYYKTIDLMREWGCEMERLTPEHVMREVEPELRIDPDQVEDVFRTPLEGWVETTVMCHAALQAAVRQHGAQVVEGAAVEIRRTGDQVDGVVLGDGLVLSADVVVNAAGPEAARVASLAGVELPVRRAPGVQIITQPLPTALRHIVHPGGYHYWHHALPGLRPESGGRIMFHSTEVDRLLAAGEQVHADHPAVVKAVEDTAAVFPALRWARVEALRTGLRSIAPDEMPIVGFDPLVHGLYHAVMHSGVTLSPIMGRLVTQEISGQDAQEFASLRIDRFPGREWAEFDHVQYAYEKTEAR